MNSPWIVVLALVIAVFMGTKPEMCIPNPKHRTPTFIRAIKYIGLSVSIVILVWIGIVFLR